jgi:glycosyltransferase involved in cell wall biosynthesis
MQEGRATVIIPCHDVEDYVEQCLDSVRDQGDVVSHTYCVENNSTDSTLARIKKWSAANPQIPLTLLEQSTPGAGAARNAPLPRVETEWIQFLDADDLLLPDKIRQQLKACEPSTDVIYDSSVLVSAAGEHEIFQPEVHTLVGLMDATLGNTSSLLLRTEAVARVGGWDETLSSSQEYDLMHRIFLTGAGFQRLDTGLTHIRARVSGQISQGNHARRKENAVDLRLRILSSLEGGSLSEEEHQRVLTGFLTGLRLLYPHNRSRALLLYEQHLKASGFRIQRNRVTPRSYQLLFRFLGFDLTERLRWIADPLISRLRRH